MRKSTLFLSILVVLAGAAAAGDHPMRTKSGWFDMEKCEVCRNLLADPELLHHMTWENLKTEDGMVQIATVQPEYEASYAECMQAMNALGNDMSSGKRDPKAVKMCGSCAAFGQMMEAGVTYETIDGEAADVTIIQADDPALVARIHEYCDRNNSEMALLMGGGGDDHPHKH
ncbi:MAG: hypothetical protein R6X35_04530 [Candidatus Krumholzibacteriia bacterium]